MKQDKLKSMWLVAALVALGIGMRIFGAWCYEYSWSSDHGIASLMAKHMAEGADIPVFFYGQPYMGSFEPAVCSLFFRIFGVNELNANLGSALFGILLLPLVYLWGKDAGGRTAGLVALAFCVVGPEYFFQYQCWGNGGYAVMLLTNTLVLWLTARILARETAGERVGFVPYLALGLAGGIGWWTSQMITAALVTAALLYVVTLRWRAFSWRALSIVPAFFLGGLPFWLWNVRNDWGTFRWFARFHGEITFWRGLSLFFGKRLPELIANPDWPHGWQVATFIFYAVAVVCFLVITVRVIRRERLSGRALGMLAAALYALLFICTFSNSSHAEFNTPRYALPLMPVFAVMLGVFAAFLRDRPGWVRKLYWLPVLLLIIPHLTGLPDHLARRREHLGGLRRAHELADFLREEQISSVYAPFPMHYLNFALREEFCFVNLSSDVYAPYKVKVESADRIAVADNRGNIDGLLKTAGGAAALARRGGHSIRYDFVPPPTGRIEISPALWAGATDHLTNNVLACLSDDDLATTWRHSGDRDGVSRVEIVLREPVEVSALRVVARGVKAYPRKWQIECAVAGGWTNLIAGAEVSHYYWAGPRPYWNWDFFRLEGRFKPVVTSRLRLTFRPDSKIRTFNIAEIQLFSANTESPGEETGLAGLLAEIEKRGIETLYSDRWVANQVYKATGGRVNTCRRVIIDGVSAPLTTSVKLTKRAALLVKSDDAPQCRRVLGKCGMTLRETEVAPWVLFDFPDEFIENPAHPMPSLYWAGFSCFKDG